LEQTAPDLQAQIDRLTLALETWRESRDHLQPMEQQLAQLTERCAEILNRWTETDERHAQAVGQAEARLREWGAIENRLQQDSVQRLRELEETIEQEWQKLRRLHDEPVKQLREQAAALGETCVATANLALRGFERAEARLASIESDLQGRLNQLSRDLRAAVADLQAGTVRPALPASVAPFPLEGVLRLHEELRQDAPGDPVPPALTTVPPGAPETEDRPASADAPRQLVASTESLSARVESLERALTADHDQAQVTTARADQLGRRWRASLAAAVAALLAVALLGGWWINRRLNEAALRVTEAQQQAARASDEMAATRAEADRKLAEARQVAHTAEIVSGVLAAPDLVRLNLVGAESAAGAYAQALWSRYRGLVVSASRLPAAPAGSAYRVWLMATGTAVPVGALQPDEAGRATLAIDPLADAPRPITGVVVTLEPSAGSAQPTGPAVLARAPAAAAPAAAQ
jgi:uncharacterized protein YciW